MARAFCACGSTDGLTENESGSPGFGDLETLWVKHLLKEGIDVALLMNEPCALCTALFRTQFKTERTHGIPHLLVGALRWVRITTSSSNSALRKALLT